MRAASPLLSCPTGRQKGHPTLSAPSQHLQVPFSRPVFALCHLPCLWMPVVPQPWAMYQQKTAWVQSRGSRATHQICPCQPSAPMGRVQVAQDPYEVSAGTAAVHPREQHPTDAAVHSFRCLDVPQAHRKMLGFIWSLIKYKWHAGGWEHRDVVIPSPLLTFFLKRAHRYFT